MLNCCAGQLAGRKGAIVANANLVKVAIHQGLQHYLLAPLPRGKGAKKRAELGLTVNLCSLLLLPACCAAGLACLSWYLAVGFTDCSNILSVKVQSLCCLLGSIISHKHIYIAWLVHQQVLCKSSKRCLLSTCTILVSQSMTHCIWKEAIPAERMHCSGATVYDMQ